MTSKTSFINRGILLCDLKRFWWIGAAYLLGLQHPHPVRLALSDCTAEPDPGGVAGSVLQVLRETAGSFFQQKLILS